MRLQYLRQYSKGQISCDIQAQQRDNNYIQQLWNDIETVVDLWMQTVIT